MALYCGLSLPSYVLADGQHSRCLTEKVCLPTIVCRRVIWHLGDTEEASATALTQPCGAFQRVASRHEPSYLVQGVLTDGFDSTIKSLRTLFPGVRLGNCFRHALNKLPGKLTASASPVRKALRVCALGQRLRRVAEHVPTAAGAANGQRVRRWFQDKKAG